MKSVKSLIFICSLLVGFTQLMAMHRHQNQTNRIDVINNTKTTIDVSFPLPEKTSATIQLKKIDALHAAILNDSAEKIREAVNTGANVNQEINDKSPLLWAVLLNRYNAIETLLQLGAKPNDICAQHAINMRDIKSVYLFVKHGGIHFEVHDIESVIRTGALKLQFDISIALIKEVVNRGYDINEIWPAAIAIGHNNTSLGEEIVRFLLLRGANPNIANSNGGTIRSVSCTPLIWASVWFPNKQIAKILIEAGADANQIINEAGKTSTLLAYVLYRTGNSNPKCNEVVELLLEHGATL